MKCDVFGYTNLGEKSKVEPYCFFIIRNLEPQENWGIKVER